MEKITDRLISLNSFLLLVCAAVVFIIDSTSPSPRIYQTLPRVLSRAETAYKSFTGQAGLQLEPMVRNQLMMTLDSKSPQWFKVFLKTALILPDSARLQQRGKVARELYIPMQVGDLDAVTLLRMIWITPAQVTMPLYEFDPAQLKRGLADIGMREHPYIRRPDIAIRVAGPKRGETGPCYLRFQPLEPGVGDDARTLSLPVECKHMGEFDLTGSFQQSMQTARQIVPVLLPPGFGFLPLIEEREGLLSDIARRQAEPITKTSVLGFDIPTDTFSGVAPLMVFGLQLLMLNLSSAAAQIAKSDPLRPPIWFAQFKALWVALPIILLVALPAAAVALCTGLLPNDVWTGFVVSSEDANLIFEPRSSSEIWSNRFREPEWTFTAVWPPLLSGTLGVLIVWRNWRLSNLAPDAVRAADAAP